MKRAFFKIIAYSTLIISISIATLYGLAIGNVFGTIPKEEGLNSLKLNLASEIWSADKKIIGRIFVQNRSESSFEQYPKHLVNALVATEDQRFYKHGGVDYISLFRVAVKTILMGDKRAGGGSTITQQVAKNYFGRKNYGILTIPIIKIKEHILATRLENIYSKNEILELYLNTVPFGEGLYGIELASRRFFNKKINQLKVEESAVLIGMLKANTAYNPRLHPENSKKRRNTVLHQMLKNNYIQEEEYKSLKNKELVINYNSKEKFDPSGYFNNQVKNEAINILKEINKKGESNYNLYKDGLVINTTLNSKLQDYAVKSLLSHLKTQQKAFDREWKYMRKKSVYKNIINNEISKSNEYKKWKNNKSLNSAEIKKLLNKKNNRYLFIDNKYQIKNISIKDSAEHYLKMVHGAIIAINPKNGAILTYIGGKNSSALPYDLVYAKRQMASTFKPFVYATALEQGWKPCDYIDNSQKSYSDYDNWSPKNADDKYDGHYSMKGALTHSVNVATVATYFRAGKNNINQLVNDAGLIDYNLPDYPSVALGVESSNLMHMTASYDIFANDGYHRQPYFIESISDKKGNIIYQYKAKEAVKVLEKQNQELMQEMLLSVIENGTGRSLKNTYGVTNQFAGKTGTAQNYSDAWFIGFNPNIVVGVWSGFNNPNIHFNSANGYGSKAALPIFANFVKYSNKDAETKKYTRAVFPEVSDITYSLLDCKDYKKDNFFERNFDFLNESNTTTDKEKYKNRKKKSFWKKVFGQK